ncbi:hypothetical protein ACEV6Q_12625 [Enterobacter ludwigii]|uniref:hypothetical protein n=1 Tax=Enterobacter ludwigii TaxID=299767 RepID=UPI003BEF2A34
MKVKSVTVEIQHGFINGRVVESISINNRIVSIVSKNLDWNKNKRPVSVKSPNGESIGDFCCIHCAIDHLVERESVTMLNTETHPVPPLELFLRRMLRETLAEKSPR